jgi:ATP-dependent Clp protease ATP-binding subunit ClpA
VKLLRRRSPLTVAAANRYFSLAAEQARRLGHAHIGSEHVLLGLATKPTGAVAHALEDLGATPQSIEAEIRANPFLPPPTAIDPKALATLGIDLDAVRERLDHQFGRGALEGTRRGCWPVEPSLKRALAYAVDEADGNAPSDQHMLAALTRVSESAAARVLRRLRIDVDELLRALHED